MALAGTLKDFGLPDIVQLIGLQRKTGTLHLETPGEKVKVIFDVALSLLDNGYYTSRRNERRISPAACAAEMRARGDFGLIAHYDECGRYPILPRNWRARLDDLADIGDSGCC